MSENIDPRSREGLELLEEKQREIAALLGPIYDAAGALFVLIGLTEGKGWSTYISNANRQDIIVALEDMVVKLRNDEDMPPIRRGEPEGA